MPKIGQPLSKCLKKKTYRRYGNTKSLKSNKQDKRITDLAKNITSQY